MGSYLTPCYLTPSSSDKGNLADLLAKKGDLFAKKALAVMAAVSVGSLLTVAAGERWKTATMRVVILGTI